MNVRSKRKVQFSGDMIPLPKLREAEALGVVREDVRGVLAGGEQVQCPCCGQQAKVYSRPMNATMIRALHEIAKSMHGLSNAAIIRRTNQAGGGNTSLMQHWGFIESWPGNVWRVTARGRQFLSGGLRVPSRVLTYNNKVLGLDDAEYVGVKDIIGREFDLEEVLAAEPVVEAVMETV